MLTPKQQKIIEDSEWVINSVLNKLGRYGDEDLKQNGWLYMCQCIMRFDENRGVKWTTFAYKNIFLYLKRICAEEKKNLCEELIEEIECEEEPEVPLQLKCLYEICTDDERRYLDLKVAGYKNEEIKVLAKWGKRKLYKYIRQIKEKAKRIEV